MKCWFVFDRKSITLQPHVSYLFVEYMVRNSLVTGLSILKKFLMTFKQKYNASKILWTETEVVMGSRRGVGRGGAEVETGSSDLIKEVFWSLWNYEYK